MKCLSTATHPINCRGAALVEFAIILPLLVLLLTGIVELSNSLMSLNNLNESVRTGISYLSRQSINATRNGVFLKASEINITKTIIASNFNGAATGDAFLSSIPNSAFTSIDNSYIRIQITHNHPLIFGAQLNGFMNIFGGGFPAIIRLQADAVYRVI